MANSVGSATGMGGASQRFSAKLHGDREQRKRNEQRVDHTMKKNEHVDRWVR